MLVFCWGLGKTKDARSLGPEGLRQMLISTLESLYQDVGFGVLGFCGLGFRVLGLGFRVWGGSGLWGF